MPEDRPTISSSRVVASEVVRHSFLTVRRGFDPQEVRGYLDQVARELEAGEEREQELHRQIAEADERAEHPVIDEASLTAALGQQSAAVLRNAHDEAARVTQQAEESAVALVREAQQQATDIMVRAESAGAERIAEAELSAGTVQHEVDQRANELLTRSEQLAAEQVARAEQVGADQLADARAEAQQLLADAREQGRGMIEQAQEARRRVLSDMAHRRRVMSIQIEQFRAARDELAAAVLGLRDKVDLIVGDLAHADDDARAAAAEVAQRQPVEPDSDELLAEAEIIVAELGVDVAPSDWTPPARAVTEAPGPAHFDADASFAPEAPPIPAAAASPDGPRPSDASAPPTLARGSEAGDDTPEGQTVEDLFARLRASHSTDGPPAAVGTATDEPTPAGGTAPVKSAKTKSTASAAAGAVATVTTTERAPESIAVLEGDALALHQRGELLDPVATRLARRLKRVLQDDQNRLLDQLRAGSGAWSDALLVAEDDQRHLYADAAAAILGEAAAAGVAFAQLYGAKGKVPEDKVIDAMAEALAGTVVAPLRRRLAGTEGEEATERVGAAYREWRGERIERLVGDYALGAFCAGVQAASNKPMRWVVGGTGTGCADCDDNALAGALAPSEEFPTGHHRPPAHAGCRCLVVPTPA